MEIGIYTFAETRVDAEAGRQLDADRRIRELLEEIELADQVGLDVFGVGEHHRPDYAVSAPAIVLAAAAARTRRIRLTSAVSVLSSDDPVRVFQDFAHLDILSEGRAEITWGRTAASPGRGSTAPPSTAGASIPVRSRIRSPCGSRWEARPAR